jgi:hypothetical protein
LDIDSPFICIFKCAFKLLARAMPTGVARRAPLKYAGKPDPFEQRETFEVAARAGERTAAEHTAEFAARASRTNRVTEDGARHSFAWRAALFYDRRAAESIYAAKLDWTSCVRA